MNTEIVIYTMPDDPATYVYIQEPTNALPRASTIVSVFETCDPVVINAMTTLAMAAERRQAARLRINKWVKAMAARPANAAGRRRYPDDHERYVFADLRANRAAHRDQWAYDLDLPSD